MTTNRDLKTHQTTIRFSAALWAALEQAAHERDMSVAQYVRDAARARLDQDAAVASSDRAQAIAEGLDHAREHSLSEAESVVALWEQGRQARERARILRDRSRQQRSAPTGQPARSLAPPEDSAAVWKGGGAARERAQMLQDEARKLNGPERV